MFVNLACRGVSAYYEIIDFIRNFCGVKTYCWKLTRKASLTANVRKDCIKVKYAV
jgi:hypothetical protein